MKSIKSFYFLICFDFLQVLALPSYIKIGNESEPTFPLNFRQRSTDFYLSLNLGAIFREDQKDSHYDLAFKFAVHKINKNQHILPKTTLIYDLQYVKADDSFHANKQGDLFFSSLESMLFD